MKWFRVVLDQTGKVKYVSPQEEQKEDERFVCYIEANSAEEAGRKAMNRYAARIVKERRDRYAAEGRCRCGRERDMEGRLTCSTCDSNRTATRERIRLGKHGRNDELRLASSKKTSRDRRAEIEHEVLIKLSRRIANVKTVAGVRLLIHQRIRELQGLPHIKKAI